MIDILHYLQDPKLSGEQWYIPSYVMQDAYHQPSEGSFKGVAEVLLPRGSYKDFLRGSFQGYCTWRVGGLSKPSFPVPLGVPWRIPSWGSENGSFNGSCRDSVLGPPNRIPLSAHSSLPLRCKLE